jgi:integrase
MSERLFKRGDIWWCWVYEGGKQRKVTTRCTSKAAARSFLADLERRLADPAYAAAHATTLRAAFDQLLTDRTTRGRAAGTLHMHRVKAGHWVRILGADVALAHLSARVVDDFCARRLGEGASRNTISKELTTLRSALKVALRRGEWSGNLDAVMPHGWETGYEPRRRAPGPEEVRALCAAFVAAKKADRAAHIAWIWATASRWSESLRAARGDVDRARQVVKIRGTKTAQSDDEIPIIPGAPAELLAFALEHAPDRAGRRLFRPWGNVRRDLAVMCTKLKSAPLTANDLRRGLATWLRAAGVEPATIARVLRHADARMVERVYGRMSADAAGALIAERLGATGRSGSSTHSAHGDARPMRKAGGNA